MMKRLCRRVGLFFAPLFLFVALLEFALWRTGESWPASYVVRRQLAMGQTPSLYGRLLFSQQANVYKREMINQKRPRIVVFGTSRVLQMRDLMFRPLEAEFYNAGGMIRTSEDVTSFVAMVKGGEALLPEVFILAIDPWWVKVGEREQTWLTGDSLSDAVWLFPAHVRVARRLIQRREFPWVAVLAGAPSPVPGYAYQGIGAYPLLGGEGYRIDGSFQLRPAWVRDSVRDPRYKDRLNILRAVTQQREPFTAPVGVDESRVNALLSGLGELRRLGAEVHVFLPPFASSVQTELETSATWASFWHAYRTELPARLRAAGIPCLPLSVPHEDGFSDMYMYDGYHPTEIYAAAIVRKIVLQAGPQSRLRHVDVASLDALLAREYKSPLAFELPPEATP